MSVDTRTAALAAGGMVLTEWVSRAKRNGKLGNPVPVNPMSASALKALERFDDSACGVPVPDVKARSFFALWRQQVESLVPVFGGWPLVHCNGSTCIAFAGMGTVPRTPVGCLESLVEQWQIAAGEVFARSVLDGDIHTGQAANALELIEQIRDGVVGPLVAARANPSRYVPQVWGQLRRVALLLDSAAANQAPSSGELWDAFKDGAKEGAFNAAGWLASVIGETAAAFLLSNLGAFALVGGAIYVAVKRS